MKTSVKTSLSTKLNSEQQMKMKCYEKDDNIDKTEKNVVMQSQCVLSECPVTVEFCLFLTVLLR